MALKKIHLTIDEKLYQKISDHRMFNNLDNIVSNLPEDYISNLR